MDEDDFGKFRLERVNACFSIKLSLLKGNKKAKRAIDVIHTLGINTAQINLGNTDKFCVGAIIQFKMPYNTCFVFKFHVGPKHV